MIELLKKRLSEDRREEIAANAREALYMFSYDICPLSASALLREINPLNLTRPTQ